MRILKAIIATILVVIFILYIVLSQICMKSMRGSPRMSEEQYRTDKWQCVNPGELVELLHSVLLYYYRT